jgi:hypothetical protein
MPTVFHWLTGPSATYGALVKPADKSRSAVLTSAEKKEYADISEYIPAVSHANAAAAPMKRDKSAPPLRLLGQSRDDFEVGLKSGGAKLAASPPRRIAQTPTAPPVMSAKATQPTSARAQKVVVRNDVPTKNGRHAPQQQQQKQLPQQQPKGVPQSQRAAPNKRTLGESRDDFDLSYGGNGRGVVAVAQPPTHFMKVLSMPHEYV